MKFLATLLSAFAVFHVNAQSNRPLGSWDDFLPYKNARMVAQSPDKIFCATAASMYFVQKSDLYMERMSKCNGLSDIGFRAIEYDAPRHRSPQEAYDHPRHQQPDVYVPREQPAYQAPRHNESPRFEAPRSVETPRQQQRNSYEAPRQQERTASPRDNDGPSFKSAPSEPSSNKRSSEGKNERRPR